jgi:hypothetical protein
MLAFYLNKERLKRSDENGFSEPESYYKYLMELEGFTSDDRGNHDAHTVVLKKYFNIDSVWRMDLIPQDFIESIDKGYPVVCGLEYKISGHIAIAIGHSDYGLDLNDPYGIRAGLSDAYTRINPGYGEESGKADKYSWETLDQILFAGGGWGRIVLKST